MWRAFAVVVLLAGCGGSSSPGPDKVALDYAKALAGGNTERACGYLSANLRATIDAAGSQQGKTHCERLTDVSPAVDLPRVGRTQRDGDNAEVEITGAGGRSLVVALARSGGRWRVDDVRSP